jgi:trk system potassium uptake protein TrkA
MRFVIVGAGRVGLRTARVLAEEGHEVVLVEQDGKKVERARTEGFSVIEGDGSNEEVLQGADLERADAIAGLTGDLNVNFAACMVGKHYGCRTVLRIDEDYREEIYGKYASDVDEVVYPERLGAAGAKTALLGGDFNVIGDLTAGLALTTMTIPPDSPAVGQRVNDLDLPADALVYAHGRVDERLTIPLPGTTLEADDTVAMVVERGVMDEVRAALLGDEGGADGE